jgi:hypothetical protein
MQAINPAQQAQLLQMLASPAINSNAISGFTAVPNTSSGGVNVNFSLVNASGIASIVLLQNYFQDPASATVLTTWSATAASYGWTDTSADVATSGMLYYWLTLNPVGVSGQPVTVGPITVLMNPDLVAPPAATAISASSSGINNDQVSITVNVTAAFASSIQIQVSGYRGSSTFVAVAQQALAPIQFNLNATGETITIQAIAVSTGGTSAPSGPTTTLTLNGVATVPAQVQSVIVAQISTGNQISFPASLDKVTSYQIYSGQRGTIFSVATLLTTITSTASTIDYLDTAGLLGDWQYFVVAANAVGSSSPSVAAYPGVLFSSALMPGNVPVNTTNNATVASVDAGSSALIEVYGPGGVGTSYSRITGFGSITRPPGDVTGLAYNTDYSVLWTGSELIAVTTYPATLPDNYELVGTITTTAQGGVLGSGATVTLTISGGAITGASAGALGADYATATVVLNGGGGGSGAQITANVVNGQIPTYTVINGGGGYTTAPTGTVVGGAATGTTGGGGTTGGSGGSRIGGCVEVGTLVEVPEGTVEELLPCDEWIVLDVGEGPLYMHPETLVSVFKRAHELTANDRIEIKDGFWTTGFISRDRHTGTKVKRNCPGGVYYAGPSLIRLHNMKLGEAEA